MTNNSNPAASSKKVILVEDNQAEAELTRIVFRELSIPVEIVHCLNGEDFLQMLEGFEQQEICYVLLDLNMPRMNGYEVLEYISKDEKWKNLAVIVFSSSINSKDIDRCYEMGANAYVAKPLDLNEFDRTILSIHGFWCGMNMSPETN
jgi:two-component system, chemotaxis family, response regulator Rcp1